MSDAAGNLFTGLPRAPAAEEAFAELVRHPGVRIELCTDTPIAVAMPPARQQMFTTLAVYAFLESVFAPEATARDSARDYLLQVLPQENSGEVTVAR